MLWKKELITWYQELSSREKEVLWFSIVQQYTTQQIADTLYLSHHTIQSHLKSIREKLKINDIVDALPYYIANNSDKNLFTQNHTTISSKEDIIEKIWEWRIESREYEILHTIYLLGSINLKQIANELNISVWTIRSHFENICHKLWLETKPKLTIFKLAYILFSDTYWANWFQNNEKNCNYTTHVDTFGQRYEARCKLYELP